jgi:hypothetical protein
VIDPCSMSQGSARPPCLTLLDRAVPDALTTHATLLAL